MLPANCPVIISRQNVTQNEAKRYSRQLILPELGVAGFKRMRSSAVLVIGAGGLGASACLHLAANGIDTLGIVDHDEIEESNLPRQITYRPSDIGRKKAEALADVCRQQNPELKVLVFTKAFTSNIDNAVLILFDCESTDSRNDNKRRAERPNNCYWNVVLDCVDNASTRYLLNDLCNVMRIPLVSGAALKWEGQLTSFMFNKQNQDDSGTGVACRCCWWPVSDDEDQPKTNATTHCSAGECAEFGVFGPVPGLIGTMQAIEALKICAGLEPSFGSGQLLLYDAVNSNSTFRTIKMPSKSSNNCYACMLRTSGAEAQCDAREMMHQILRCRNDDDDSSSRTADDDETIEAADNSTASAIPRLSPQHVLQLLTLDSANSSSFTTTAQLSTIPEDAGGGGDSRRISDSSSTTSRQPVRVIVDVRPQTEMEICSLPCSVNLPFQQLLYGDRTACMQKFSDFLDTTFAGNKISATTNLPLSPEMNVEVIILCRRGNDSQLAYPILNEFAQAYNNSSGENGGGDNSTKKRPVKIVGDMIGGLTSWSKQVDKTFPMY